MIYKRISWGEEAKFSSTVDAAIKNSKYILGLHTNFINTDASREALKNGSRILATQPWGIEEYLINGVLDVDVHFTLISLRLCSSVSKSRNVMRFFFLPARVVFIPSGVTKKVPKSFSLIAILSIERLNL